METLKKILADEDEVDLTPMIDVTFLLLIYFMVTTMLKQPEAELSSSLPGKAQNSGENVKKPDPVKIKVQDDGSVFLNGSFMDDGLDFTLPETSKNLAVQVQEANKNIANGTFTEKDGKLVVMISATGLSIHQHRISVMNACAGAGVEKISFEF
jgi:biopolymer transport protein ExbD|tara:strand:- start:396 stop:857 length:462 start_codon:yes stop_codon:yes gene_type:complete